MKKNEYITPDIQVVNLKTNQCLLVMSGETYNQDTSNVETQEGGSFGAKGGGFWSYEEED